MVKCPGVIGWKANARPPGWKVWENAPLLPGWGLLELTDALKGRYQVNFRIDTKLLLLLSDFSKTQRYNLKTLVQLFQIAIHFHLGHPQLKILTDSLDTLTLLPSTKLDYYFVGSIDAYKTFGFSRSC